jgi:hypothetical protein
LAKGDVASKYTSPSFAGYCKLLLKKGIGLFSHLIPRLNSDVFPWFVNRSISTLMILKLLSILIQYLLMRKSSYFSFLKMVKRDPLKSSHEISATDLKKELEPIRMKN